MRSKRSPWLLVKQRGTVLVHCISFLLLINPAAYQLSEACLAAAEQEEAAGSSSSDTVLLCRACGHELAVGTDIHFVPSRLALSSRNETLAGGRKVNVQLFENPHGHQFEVITFRKADVTQHWPAEKHFSWFPGFSWTVATCPRCRTHLGGYKPSEEPSVKLLSTRVRKAFRVINK